MIRVVTEQDVPAICAIYNQFIEQSAGSFECGPLSEPQMQERISRITADLPWLVCEEEGGVLGYAFATWWQRSSPYCCTVETAIYLAAGARGHNLGTALYRSLIAALREKGIHVVLACIALPNPASVQLHEKMGFAKAGRFKEVGYRENRWLDVGYWQLTLSRARSGQVGASSDPV